MTDKMDFPDTVEEFMEQYKVVDTDGVYMSKGSELVPIFRMRQWFEQLPSTQPTAEQIQKMQDIEQAQFEKAYELGKAEGQKEITRCRDCKYYRHEDYGLPYCNRITTGFYAIDLDDFCSKAEGRTE